MSVRLPALWLALCALRVRSGSVPATECERAPPHAQPSDALHRLGVAGDPDLFLPGELYTVSLQGVDSGEGPTPFTGFKIWAELDEKEHPVVVKKDDTDTREDMDEIAPANISLGTFQAYDAQAKLSEVCEPSVVNATAHPKIEIQVLWNAPLSWSMICVRLCARASEGAVLSRRLCAAPAAPAGLHRQPPIVEPCCACDEAKYEVTFEGLWSRNTHPREFPAEDARAHFSDVIGASHTAQFRVWQEGRVASAGLRRLADDGATTALEKELKAESNHIRTIIKARGISWQQVNGGTASTFAVFRVDAKNHLVSLASKLAPSPDWIVGVSALELCNANCTWRRSFSLPLFPYDAGTDDGISYTASRRPTIPASPVRALRPDWPKDSKSPFFNTNGEMRPFARLRFNRLRLYEKSCEPVESTLGSGGSGSCAVGAWGAWGACSVSCGRGRSLRHRRYLRPARAKADACREPLSDHTHCYGPTRHCRAPSEYEAPPWSSSGPCAVSAWSEWSPCTGCGVRMRSRQYVSPRAMKRCHVGRRARTPLQQTMPCEAGPCDRPANSTNSTNFDWFYVDRPRPPCATAPWGQWSPCSSRCGRGRRLRGRLYVVQPAPLQRALGKALAHQWATRFSQLQGLEIPSDNSSSAELEEQVRAHLEQCQFTLTQQEALCDGLHADCYDTLNPEVCKLPLSVGPCRGFTERWFFDAARNTCEPFGYTGCGGNHNNFKDQQHCVTLCLNGTQPTPDTATAGASSVANKTKQLQSNEDNEVMQNDSSLPDGSNKDCEVSPWRGWSDCCGECDNAIKLNYRLIKRLPSGDGKLCPALMKSRLCRPAHCRPAHCRPAHCCTHQPSTADHGVTTHKYD